MVELVCSSTSDFTAQGPSESDLSVSTRWHWTRVAAKFSQDSPKIAPGCPKLAPELTQATLKTSKDSPKIRPGAQDCPKVVSSSP